MPKREDDTFRSIRYGGHPPGCTCAECTERRLKKLKREANPSHVSRCPRCGKKSLWYNVKEHKYECLNLKCKAVGSSPSEIAGQCKPSVAQGDRNRSPIGKETVSQKNVKKITKHRIPNWVIALLFIFALSICGLGISLFIDSFIPFWLLFGFSLVYSVEKWFSYITRRYKWIGKFYRLFLNLSILSLLGLVIWSSIKLFSKQFVYNPLVGSLIFLAEFAFFVWMWRVVAKNSWRWPSMKLTVFSVICLLVVLAFAGVSPFSGYKDNFLNLFSDTNDNNTITQPPADNFTTPAPDSVTKPVEPSQSTTMPTTPPGSVGIDSQTGEYENYFLGLVKEPDGVLGGNDCYGEFIILINNKNAKNPTYAELLNFLSLDKTDEFPYQYMLSVMGFYYGEAEDKIDLDIIKSIIDGIAKPIPPKICADFAERLHNDAEMAGIRCAYVSVSLSGYADPYNYGITSDTDHALNAFETTDRGLVYIDVTGLSSDYGPSSCDKIVDVRTGKEFIPQSLFPEPGWYSTWDSMGTVTGIFITWDGDWR